MGKPITFYFHYENHGKLEHCQGGPANPYQTKHSGRGHLISKQYARGHGVGNKPQWFKFTKKHSPGWWVLESGEMVDVESVPKGFK